MNKPRVYFDGLCPLCSREIDTYRRSKGSAQLEFVDITDPKFSAEAEGLDTRAVNKHLHVRRADGSLAIGVDAFAEIWHTLPNYRWLSRLIRIPPVKFFAAIGYRGFARVRPYLPRRQRCDVDCKI